MGDGAARTAAHTCGATEANVETQRVSRS